MRYIKQKLRNKLRNIIKESKTNYYDKPSEDNKQKQKGCGQQLTKF